MIRCKSCQLSSCTCGKEDWEDYQTGGEAKAENADLRATITEKDKRIAELESTPADKREDLRCVISDLCGQVRERDTRIAQLERQRDELLAEINNKSQQIAHLIDEEIAEVINQCNTVDGNRYLPFAYARAIEVAILNKLETGCEIIRDKGDMGTMRTVVWKDGILPEVGAKLYRLP